MNNNKSIDICCLGIVCADILAKPVNKLPERGKLEFTDQFTMEIGGCASNAAIDLAKLSVKTGLITLTGDDAFGRMIKDGCASCGVDVSAVRSMNNVNTSASFVAIDGGGERSIVHYKGANAVFSYKDVDMGYVKRAEYLFVAGTFLMPSFDGEDCGRVLKEAKAAGVICCMDTAWDAAGKWLDTIKNNLQYLDWFMPSFDEAKAMCGTGDYVKMAETFKSFGVRNVIIKLGSEGAYVSSKDNDNFLSPAFKCNAMDASGAGDSFCAGFLMGLVKGWDLRKCARFANAVGYHCVQSIGTTTGIKSFEQIMGFLNGQA